MHNVSFMHVELSNGVETKYFKVEACLQHAWKLVV